MFTVVSVVSTTPAHAQAVSFNDGSPPTIGAISDFGVDGVYNVEMVYDTSFDDLFGTGTPTGYAAFQASWLNDEPGAVELQNAIVTTLNAGNVAAPVSTTYLIPYAITDTEVTVLTVATQSFFELDTWVAGGPNTISRSFFLNSPGAAYVARVPEPTLIGAPMIGAALLYSRRRRRLKGKDGSVTS